ncbi:MAG: hypothetical protein LBN27_01415 [Prevotellaceae bacterium]|jgi:hypothetical protein|nr:hypothetical protein [Prevotellaceae bacterium]
MNSEIYEQAFAEYNKALNELITLRKDDRDNDTLNETIRDIEQAKTNQKERRKIMNSNVTNGKLTLPNGGKYEGEILNGEPNGKGVVKYDNGTTFEGTFRNGLPNGKCRQEWVNGMYLESVYKDGEPVDGIDKCKFIYDDGSYYEGDCINGNPEPNGWGKMY